MKINIIDKQMECSLEYNVGWSKWKITSELVCDGLAWIDG